jgi:type I restriction enzyme S subunit
MSEWPRIALGDIFDIARGGSPRPIDDYITDAEDGVNWISIADASDSSKYIERTKRRIRPEGVSRSRSVVPGDFLLTNSMSFGRPYIMRTTGCIHDGWLVLGKKREGIDQDFFFRLLGSKSVYAAFARLAAGATVKNLNIDLVKGVEVPVPPLVAQRRIAAILDQADALRTQRRQALAELDKLAQAVFVEIFGDSNTNPKGWPLGSLKSLGKVLTGGTPPSDQEGMFGGATPFLTPGDLESNSMPKRTVTEAGAQAAVTIRAGSTLVCCIGATIGKTDIARVRSAFNQQLNGVEWGSSVDDIYGLFALRALKPVIISRGASTTLPILKKSAFEQLSISVPPKPIQHIFNTRIQAIESLKSTRRAALAESDALFASLQHRAFSGAL